ncbi:MFS transporter [Nocardioides yefusunii]|uniref:MFS transporter n=1 Tax=Nocardioides yefusunii TaxID=2500546 RepID=A0ABW1QS88_9ACTN|nr:MFS transporter [Nocardioides yefusunii]
MTLPPTVPAPPPASDAPLPHRRALHVAAAISTYDRFVVIPLLVILATAFDRPVAELLVLAVGHQIAYGVGQPLWGALSDRFGRVRVIRFALIAGALAAIGSAASVGVEMLLVLRILAGGLFGAVVPTVMAYVADKAPAERRRSELSGLMRSIAVGTGSATAVSGLIGQYVGWRAAFVVPAVLALGAAWALRNVTPPATRNVVSLRQSLPGLRKPAVLLVLALVLVEGALVLGGLQLLPTALQDTGRGAALSGLVAALFGVAVVLVAGIVSRLGSHVPLSTTATIGAVALFLAGVVLTMTISTLTVAIAAVLLAVTWAFLHNALQTWVSEIDVPGRGLVVSCFAGCLFLGSALGAWLAQGLVETGEWRLLFAVGAVASAVLGLVTVACRLRVEAKAR